jgi:hypothetical protein
MTTKMAKKGSKKAAKKKVQKPTRPKPRKGQKMADCGGIYLSTNASALTITVDSQDEFTASVTVEGGICRSFFQKCWNGQSWGDC